MHMCEALLDSRMYLAHHELESVVFIIIIVIAGFSAAAEDS